MSWLGHIVDKIKASQLKAKASRRERLIFLLPYMSISKYLLMYRFKAV